jgi:Arm DNA-binding domain
MLSDTKARQAQPREKPYKLADQGALYLLVSPTGAKSWRYDYRLHGYSFGKAYQNSAPSPCLRILDPPGRHPIRKRFRVRHHCDGR